MESRAPSGKFFVSRTSNVGGTGSRVTVPNYALSGGESSMKLEEYNYMSMDEFEQKKYP